MPPGHATAVAETPGLIAAVTGVDASIELESAACSAGGTVKGTFRFGGEDVKARKVVVALRQHKFDPSGNQGALEASKVEFDGGTVAAGEWAFELPVPAGAVPSFSVETPHGDMGYSWDVEGKLDRKLRADVRASAPLVVYNG